MTTEVSVEPEVRTSTGQVRGRWEDGLAVFRGIAQAAGGGRVHLYELTWPAPVGEFGACHGLDIPLLFGTTDADLGLLLLEREPSVEVRQLSAHFRTAWTSFAATGDPGWPAFDNSRRLTQIFDTTPTITPYPEEISRQLWQRHDFAPLPLGG